jgi:hypothetical protein
MKIPRNPPSTVEEREFKDRTAWKPRLTGTTRKKTFPILEGKRIDEKT